MADWQLVMSGEERSKFNRFSEESCYVSICKGSYSSR